MAATDVGDHSDELAEFGSKQQLERTIDRFASFAAGGLAYYLLVQHHKTGVLDGHRFASPSDAVPEPVSREG